MFVKLNITHPRNISVRIVTIVATHYTIAMGQNRSNLYLESILLECGRFGVTRITLYLEKYTTLAL